jgi:hypothetical protein
LTSASETAESNGIQDWHGQIVVERRHSQAAESRGIVLEALQEIACLGRILQQLRNETALSRCQFTVNVGGQ